MKGFPNCDGGKKELDPGCQLESWELNMLGGGMLKLPGSIPTRKT